MAKKIRSLKQFYAGLLFRRDVMEIVDLMSDEEVDQLMKGTRNHPEPLLEAYQRDARKLAEEIISRREKS